ncbi:hypothetical protein K2173_004286 [Erythroxylum novogranatense]|uniref:Retrotransposon gag domain-containing protein n=1 Tax=Erythroxylum novogranatense TaxID=1862640 RepID=A0AAV8U2F6_9ROSI|nr:hypothetical protein K2173_004286 [Erythroxylum novogranatense]
MFLGTAKEIWDAIKQTYSKVHDAAQIYEIKTKISNTKQGNRSVTDYSNFLKSLWQEMDHYQCIQMQCSEDVSILRRFVERDRIYDFLAGLNLEFDAVRVQILGKEELSSLNEVMVDTPAVDSSVLVFKSSKEPKNVNKDTLWCPMKLFCDNKSAISIAHNPIQHDRTKHIEVDRHFIKEKLDSGLICTPFISTSDQLADMLTKGLSGATFQRLVSKLGMDDIHLPA